MSAGDLKAAAMGEVMRASKRNPIIAETQEDTLYRAGSALTFMAKVCHDTADTVF